MSICISWSSSEHYTWLWSHTTKQKHNTHPLACHNIANTSSKHYINNLDLHTTTQNHNTQPRIASKNIANTNQSLTIYTTNLLSVYSLYIFFYLYRLYVCIYICIHIYIYIYTAVMLSPARHYICIATRSFHGVAACCSSCMFVTLMFLKLYLGDTFTAHVHDGWEHYI